MPKHGSKEKSPHARPIDKEVLAKAIAARRNFRETIESVAIAFILAFLFRTFEAEAFVIPTGSMAPTLQGQHKDVECYMCRYRYRINASQEDSAANPGAETDVIAGTCPQCRYTMPLDALGENVEGRADEEVIYGAQQATYPGDRILVGKFVYDFQDPQRWDVVVFKYPGDTKMNYIKRLVGLPGEELRIRHGDIYARPLNPAEPAAQIQRKSHEKLQAMAQMVFDSTATCSQLVRSNWPHRWNAWPRPLPGEEGPWQIVPLTAEQLEDYSVSPVYTVAGGQSETRWLRYQHVVPSFRDWERMAEGPLGDNYPARAQLITDFYAYNAGVVRGDGPQRTGSIAPHTSQLGLNWVGDLMLEAEVEVQTDQGEVLLDLVEGGYHFTCRIDVATGAAKLSSSAESLKDFQPKAETSVRGAGSYSLRFANADDKLYLWVDDEPVEFDAPTTYDLEIDRPMADANDPLGPGDLAPAGIGSQGAGLRVTALRLLRDIYYIADSYDNMNRSYNGLSDYPDGGLHRFDPEEFAQFLSSPSQWEVFTKRAQVSFTLEENRADPGRDQYFMLGDNSPFSKDSRLWPNPRIGLNYYVERQLLIGKALCIYWPHSWHRIPGVRIPFPYFPNFGDMGFVR